MHVVHNTFKSDLHLREANLARNKFWLMLKETSYDVSTFAKRSKEYQELMQYIYS